MNAHFRFGFFVAAALVPDALLAGTSLVAGFAASRLLPANAPLLPFPLGSVADRLRPSLDPAVPFSTLFDERPLLSVVFFTAAFAPLLFATLVAAFFKLTVAAAFAGAALFFSTSILTFFGGDFELFLTADTLGATLGFSTGAVLVDLGGETEVLLLVIVDAGAFLAAGTYFLVSSLAFEAERLGFFSTDLAFSTIFFSTGFAFSTGLAFSTTFFSTGFFSVTFLTTAFLAVCLGGETEGCFFHQDTTTAGLTAALTLTLARGLERERGATEADLLTLASLTSALRAALLSRLRRGALGGLLLLARTATVFFSTFFGDSLRLGAVTLLCSFLGGDAIFFDDFTFSTIVLDAFSALGGDTDFLGAGFGAGAITLTLDSLRLARRTGDAVAAGFFSALATGALIVTAFLNTIVADFFGDSTILAAAGF